VDADIARYAMGDPQIRRLMTVPGVDVTVASGVSAAIGDIKRFAGPQTLVAYLGLNPSVRQSGEGRVPTIGVGAPVLGRARG
jgi:transposase